jgi:hypothetical protein
MFNIQSIANELNSEKSIEAGMANENSVVVNDNVVTFTYPAPVLSGACCATITVNNDGTVFDDITDQTFDTIEKWVKCFQIDCAYI